MSWQDAGFPYPYLVPSTTAAQALYDALTERLYLTQAERDRAAQGYSQGKYGFHRPELLSDKYQAHYREPADYDIMGYIDDRLDDVLWLYYDHDTYNWQETLHEKPYWGLYDNQWDNTQRPTKEVLQQRGLYEGEELIEWQVKGKNYFSVLLAEWADQRRRFLNLLKWRVFNIKYTYTYYQKYIDVSGKRNNELDYKEFVVETVKHPDTIEDRTGGRGRHGYAVSLATILFPWEDQGTLIVKGHMGCSVWQLKAINVEFVEGYELAGREFVFKYEAHRPEAAYTTYTYNFLQMPFHEGKHEWHFSAVENEVPFEVPTQWDAVRAQGQSLFFDYDWEKIPIETPPPETEGHRYPRPSRMGFEIGSGLFSTDISDTYKYKEPENEN